MRLSSGLKGFGERAVWASEAAGWLVAAEGAADASVAAWVVGCEFELLQLHRVSRRAYPATPISAPWDVRAPCMDPPLLVRRAVSAVQYGPADSLIAVNALRERG